MWTEDPCDISRVRPNKGTANIQWTESFNKRFSNPRWSLRAGVKWVNHRACSTLFTKHSWVSKKLADTSKSLPWGLMFLRFNGQEVWFGGFAYPLVHEMLRHCFGINSVYIRVRHHITVALGQGKLDFLFSGMRSQHNCRTTFGPYSLRPDDRVQFMRLQGVDIEWSVGCCFLEAVSKIHFVRQTCGKKSSGWNKHENHVIFQQ